MTPAQELHLLDIKRSFDMQVDRKYRKGQKEHGGDLLDVPAIQILDYAIDEAIDQVVYLLTLREKVRRMK